MLGAWKFHCANDTPCFCTITALCGLSGCLDTTVTGKCIHAMNLTICKVDNGVISRPPISLSKAKLLTRILFGGEGNWNCGPFSAKNGLNSIKFGEYFTQLMAQSRLHQFHFCPQSGATTSAASILAHCPVRKAKSELLIFSESTHTRVRNLNPT